eukprot:gene9949-18562_t
MREALVFGYSTGVLDEGEFVMLDYLNGPRNIQISYWQYAPFNLDLLSDDKCWAEFRFKKNHIFDLAKILQLPDETITYNRMKEDAVEGLCVLLKRLAYLCEYSDLVYSLCQTCPRIICDQKPFNVIHS